MTPEPKENLGDTLCIYCPREENRRCLYSVPGGYAAGCEGSDCDAAYDNYCDEINNPPVMRPITGVLADSVECRRFRGNF